MNRIISEISYNIDLTYHYHIGRIIYLNLNNKIRANNFKKLSIIKMIYNNNRTVNNNMR